LNYLSTGPIIVVRVDELTGNVPLAGPTPTRGLDLVQLNAPGQAKLFANFSPVRSPDRATESIQHPAWLNPLGPSLADVIVNQIVDSLPIVIGDLGFGFPDHGAR
jgi:hypothetical protein